jgi:hypothetical protein
VRAGEAAGTDEMNGWTGLVARLSDVIGQHPWMSVVAFVALVVIVAVRAWKAPA